MIIFDLDGTLWDASEALAASWGAEIARLLGRETRFTIDEIHAVLGSTMDEIADALMPDVPAEERYRIFRSCEGCEIDYIREHGGNLFPNERETLDKLKASGRRMAVVSNCQKGYIGAFLDSMNMHEYFCDYEEWGRTHLSKGENIRLVMERNAEDKAIYIGDIQKDADASAAAGVPCIWAKYGFGEIAEPAAVLERFEDLPEILEALGY